MEKQKNEDSMILDMFGLTYEQSLLMFSVQKMITEYDCMLSTEKKLTSEKKTSVKIDWLKNWEKSIGDYLKTNDRECHLLSERELQDAFVAEVKKSPNRTWYYMVVLECLEFVPYTALGSGNDKEYSKCSHDEKKCYEMIKSFFAKQGIIPGHVIGRLHQTYEKSLNKISGKTSKIMVRILTVVAIAAATTAVAAVAAGPIAVALLGSNFAGLSGAALTSACLALAGGGAIAAGGAGMAGGIMVIAGGGALLGLAGGGTVVSLASVMLLSSPEYTLTQAAKLETILKEVVLNAQQDVVCAQRVIQHYKEQIILLNQKLTELELEDKKNKQEIKNIQLCIKYMKKSCQDVSAFTSAYAIGLEEQKNDKR